MIGKYTKTGMFFLLTSFAAFSAPYFEENTPPSFADNLHLSHISDSMDENWLPDITVLPDKTEVARLTEHMAKVMEADKDTKCTSVNLNLRMLIFQHFVIYQHMVNAEHIFFDEKTAHQWAHVLGMILQESSGDSANITSMSGRSISTYSSETDLKEWRVILNLTRQSRIHLNYQTNFGLTQTSADRLFDAFRLSKDQTYDTTFLEGRQGASTPGKVVLNTAIAIRRLIWFYKGFAQGRTSESEGRLPKQDITKPQYLARYRTGLNMALMYCGTQFMFKRRSPTDGIIEHTRLLKAMASIAYCKLGDEETGFGVNTVDEKCFAEWVTLCPALNIDIATLTPLSYFASRKVGPVCEDTFNRLIIKKPPNQQGVETNGLDVIL